MKVHGKRRRGRLKRRWLDNIKNDLPEKELSGEESQDRVKWRRLIRRRRRTLLTPTEIHLNIKYGASILGKNKKQIKLQLSM